MWIAQDILKAVSNVTEIMNVLKPQGVLNGVLGLRQIYAMPMIALVRYVLFFCFVNIFGI